MENPLRKLLVSTDEDGNIEQETSDNMTENEDEPEESEEEEQVTVQYEAELTYDYTEHDGVAIFADGTERRYTFDVMDKSSNEIVLKDYTDSLKLKKTMVGKYAKPEGSLAFATIERDNLFAFETTERRDEEKQDTTTIEKEVSRSKAEEMVEKYDDAIIKEDEQEE